MRARISSILGKSDAHRAPLQMSQYLDKSIAAGLLSVMIFTTLAHGAVEPWSLALFELMVVGLLLLWGIKATLDRRLEITIPATALPIAALLLLGMTQSVAFTDAAGQRASLSMDVEATRRAVTVIFFLGVSFVVAANFFITRERLFLLANLLTVFGAVVAAFALIQYFRSFRVWAVRQPQSICRLHGYGHASATRTDSPSYPRPGPAGVRVRRRADGNGYDRLGFSKRRGEFDRGRGADGGAEQATPPAPYGGRSGGI